MKKWMKSIACVTATGFLTLSYNACSKLNGFNVLDSADTSSLGSSIGEGPLAANQLAAGKDLYEKNCALCHGTLAVSTKLGKSAFEITQAIATVPSMTSLQSLTSEQVAQIALALNTNILSLRNDAGASTRLLISNRYLLASQLNELFVASSNLDSNDTSIQTTINSLIMNHAEGFGGNCSRNDPGCVANPCANNGTCRGKLNSSENAEVNPSSSPVRKGYLIQACEKILTIDKSVGNLGLKASIDITQSPDLSTLNSLALFVFRELPPDSSVINQLLTLATTAKSGGMAPLDQWRFVMLALCQSSSMDLL
ncbi:MAG: c-type cytochrome [Pseudobdellovibrionaceae bacterium]